MEASSTQSTSLVPVNAYLYFPPDDQKSAGQGKKYDRLIFEGDTKYNEQETQAIDSIEAELRKQNIALPAEWTKANSLKFLIAFGFNQSKTIQGMVDYIEWRRTTIPIQLSSVIQQYLNMGLLYFHGRDNRFRPIIYLNCYMIDTKTMDTDNLLLTVAFFLEYVIDNLMLPGQIERWVVIEDLKGMGITNIPFGVIKKILGFLQNNFRSRLYKLYIMNCPTSAYLTWKMVKPLLEETTVQKINLSKDSKNEDMWKHINKSQIEEKFGGTARTIEKNFWPPKEIGGDNFVAGDNPNALLKTKEDYIQMHRDGKLAKYKVCKDIVQ